MARRENATPSQITNALPRAGGGAANGKSVREVCKTLAVSEHTYYRWRREYGGMNTAQAKKLKELEKENQRLKRAVADLTLDNLILKEVARSLGRARGDSVESSARPGELRDGVRRGEPTRRP